MAKKKKRDKIQRVKVFNYRGYTPEELGEMDPEKIAELMPARQRRSLRRGTSRKHKDLLQRIRNGDENLRTHLRDMIILPEMVGATISVHDGRNFNRVEILPEMIGHYLGEFALTRRRVAHGSAGIGATKSSKYVPLK
jgi:small subunit ribosomal protein S19